jgi:hypothetical protein
MSTASAAKAEATNADVTFDYDGTTYTIPATKDWDLDVLENYEDGKIAATVKAVLGADQYAKFRSKPRTVSHLRDLFEALQTAVGIAGN